MLHLNVDFHDKDVSQDVVKIVCSLLHVHSAVCHDAIFNYLKCFDSIQAFFERRISAECFAQKLLHTNTGFGFVAPVLHQRS